MHMAMNSQLHTMHGLECFAVTKPACELLTQIRNLLFAVNKTVLTWFTSKIHGHVCYVFAKSWAVCIVLLQNHDHSDHAGIDNVHCPGIYVVCTCYVYLSVSVRIPQESVMFIGPCMLMLSRRAFLQWRISNNLVWTETQSETAALWFKWFHGTSSV
jgi:hypothetical protein